MKKIIFPIRRRGATGATGEIGPTGDGLPSSDADFTPHAIPGTFQLSDSLPGKFIVDANGNGFYNSRFYEYSSTLNQTYIDADSGDYMWSVNGLPGGFYTWRVSPIDLDAFSGQSNIVNSAGNTEGSTPLEPRFFVWDARIDGNDNVISANRFVVGQENQSPYSGGNNMSLQMGKASARQTGKVTMSLLLGRGSKAISNWLTGNYTDHIRNEMVKIFSDIGIGVFTIRSFTFIQGGASVDQAMDSISVEKRASTSDQLISWAGGVREFNALLADEEWYSKEDTMFVLGTGSFVGGSSRFNDGITALARAGVIPKMGILDTRFHETYDKLHYDGETLTRIGEQLAEIVISKKLASPSGVGIGSEVKLPLSSFGAYETTSAVAEDIEAARQATARAMEVALMYAATFEFYGDGFVWVDTSAHPLVDMSALGNSAAVLPGTLPKQARVGICGSLTGSLGVSDIDQLVDGDVAGNLAKAQAVYDSAIRVETRFANWTGTLAVKDILIYSDVSNTFDCMTFTRGDLVFSNVTIHGFNSGSAGGVVVTDGGVRKLNTASKLRVQHCRGNASKGGVIDADKSEIEFEGLEAFDIAFHGASLTRCMTNLRNASWYYCGHAAITADRGGLLETSGSVLVGTSTLRPSSEDGGVTHLT